MKLAVCTALLLAAVTAHADPAKCTATGPVLFDQTVEARPGVDGSRVTASRFALYDNGAWTHAVTAQGTSSATAGCADPTIVARIELRIAAATWKVTQKKITCRAYALTQTVYAVHGTPVFTETTCGRDELDADSARVLADVKSAVQQLVSAAGPASGRRG
jgi:hypothetical protein